jgi:integrase
MWSTGAHVSEVLALTPASFIDDGYDVGVIFRTLKSNSGRDANMPPRKIPKRFVPIADPLLKERIANYLWAGRFKRAEPIFPIVRQTVTRHIHKLVERAGGAPFNITAHTRGIRSRSI